MHDRKHRSTPSVPVAQTVATARTPPGEVPDEADEPLLVPPSTRSAARPPAPRVTVRHEPPGPVAITAADGCEGQAPALLATFATTSAEFQARTMQELLEAGCRGSSRIAFEEWDVNGALAALHGIAPRDETEALLATQMVAVHSAAMRCLRQLKGSEMMPQQDSNGRLAVKLLRTFTQQLEALQRYRGNGEQKMTVEHVHVHAGGQAIVGEINSGSRGEGPPEAEDRAHARTIAHAPEPPMPSSYPQREAVPIPAGPRQA